MHSHLFKSHNASLLSSNQHELVPKLVIFPWPLQSGMASDARYDNDSLQLQKHDEELIGMLGCQQDAQFQYMGAVGDDKLRLPFE